MSRFQTSRFINLLAPLLPRCFGDVVICTLMLTSVLHFQSKQYMDLIGSFNLHKQKQMFYTSPYCPYLLPVSFTIDFKIVLLVFKALSGLAPTCICDGFESSGALAVESPARGCKWTLIYFKSLHITHYYMTFGGTDHYFYFYFPTSNLCVSLYFCYSIVKHFATLFLKGAM